MNWQAEYERKQVTLDEIFEKHLTGSRLLGRKQRIYMGGLHVATTIINALLDHIKAGTLHGVDIYANWMNGDITFADIHTTPDNFRYHTYFAGPNERTGFAAGSGCVAHIPVHFSDTNRMLRELDLDWRQTHHCPNQYQPAARLWRFAQLSCQQHRRFSDSRRTARKRSNA